MSDASYRADLLVGEDLHVAPKLSCPKAPGVWVESFPGEPYGVHVHNASSNAVHAFIFIDEKLLQTVQMGPGTQYDFKSILSQVKDGWEYRAPLVFGTPLVVERQDGEEARVEAGVGISAASKLGVVRVEFRSGYYRPSHERAAQR